VNDLRNRGLQAQIAAVAVDAGIVREALAVAAEAELIVGLIEIARAEDKFSLTVTLEAGPRDHVEHAVSAIPEFRPITSATHFQIVNIFRVKLRSGVRGDVRIGDRNAVNQPNWSDGLRGCGAGRE